MGRLPMSFCRACGSQNAPARVWVIPEMMRGTGEHFDYGECSNCSSLWLLDIPKNLNDYYGTSYYSFGASWRKASPWRRWAKRARDAWQLWGSPFWGGLLAARSRYPELDSLHRAGLKIGDRVLDVGCGDGLFVASLAAQGMDAIGIDPFLPEDEQLQSGSKLLRRSIVEMEGTFDFIVFNHSLEHMADPASALRAAFQLVVPGGRCLVRVPTCSSEAWQRFQGHWIQLDPPRHLVLFSRDALKALAVAEGWTVIESFDDSGSFQFWGSLQAEREIPLEDPRSISRGGKSFSPAELREFEAAARTLNLSGRGDSLALTLLKPAERHL